MPTYFRGLGLHLLISDGWGSEQGLSADNGKTSDSFYLGNCREDGEEFELVQHELCTVCVSHARV